ncbi:LOW QUALITY PROTEIN: m-AAA protease-interacting protein 1, mitochondrial-like [Thamnophis elegans]|uniref:LOW QUALITY PROTEIN: m-AAA protease-interacting protein 1, mitochondrial-like n=1 Tax=Thamnophis elegans TaxID=35005 RepID=UPI0013777C2A|nr:LOW QUALITY PROTEIN: m-AAA protease-interacting protein 1, mitochondrial-like [Thamnophis elegans]
MMSPLGHFLLLGPAVISLRWKRGLAKLSDPPLSPVGPYTDGGFGGGVPARRACYTTKGGAGPRGGAKAAPSPRGEKPGSPPVDPRRFSSVAAARRGGPRRGVMGLARGVLCRRWQLLRGFPAVPSGSSAQRGGGLGYLLPPSGRCPLLPAPPARFYSSGNGDSKSEVRAVFFGFPNPLRWLRTRLYFFLIRTYFDRDFSAPEFMQGAKHAFTVVSRLISQCKYDVLEELVSKEMIQVLREKLSSLSENHRKALAAEMDEIMFTATGDVGIYYDDSGRKFVSILMSFWYLSSADIPDKTPEGAKVFQIVLRGEHAKKKTSLLANYEFRREFTQGVKPDWMITWIEHPNLLE